MRRSIDAKHMARCLELAGAYRGLTTPNPIVGCVIVDARGKVIAEGAHKKTGTDHAEIVALKKLRMRAKGATLYVNLEPCNHTGRTGPCAPVVRDAGVARVVVGMEDPVADHAGGISLLKRAGIAVTTGVLRAQCERANLAWITAVTKQRCAFTIKAAMTLDGKLATSTGDSKWITGLQARADAHRLRATHDAIMVGIGTVLADNPRLDVRLVKGRSPIRIVLDSQLRTPTDAYLLPKTTRSAPRTIIVCGTKASPARERALRAERAEIWRMPTHRNGRIDVFKLAERLAEERIYSVLVEGGAGVHAAMFEQRLVDEFVVYIAPKIIGGPGISWVGGKGLADMSAAWRLAIDERIDDFAGDLRLTGTVLPVKEHASDADEPV
ncbi:MAG TPA: bifunctional diaminohydroxyphosphoribosylaminopyrimidine deaminase/5-amino-6-(5-phosphoribosylamino)uracil reductase RibD [Kofleriaceae bacterium]